MQRSLLILFMLYLGLIAGSPGYAQCNITQNSGTSPVAIALEPGQSFQAKCTGSLDYISIRPLADGTGYTIKVYEGDGFGGTVLGTISGINLRVNGGDLVPIDLTSENISLTSGSMYTFQISDGTSSIGFAGAGLNGLGKMYFGTTSVTNAKLAFEVGMTPENTSPSAAGFTANPNEGTLYTFTTGDFSYSDDDGDPLDHITVSAPASGTLFIDSNDNDTEDVGEGVPDAADVSKADLDAGRFKYLPDGSTSSSFTFKVNDGTDYSELYTTTLTVNARPTVSISSTSADPSSDNPIPVSITFSEAVTGFTVDDLSLSNASASNFSGSDDSYSVDLTPTTEGEITLDIAADVAVDAGGAGNKADSQFSITYDVTPPTASITTEEPDPTDASPFSITISPSEAITGLTSDDLQVTNGSVTSFTPPGILYKHTIGSGNRASGNNDFDSPQGVIVASDGKIYVADAANHRIQVFNPDYSYHTTIGTGLGSGENQFNNPTGVAIGSDEKVYVADANNHRVQVFNEDYSYHATIGAGLSGPGNDRFNTPMGVTVSPDGKVYVADAANNRIQVFDENYSYLTTIGTGTGGNTNDELNYPAGVTISSDGKIYVADLFNHRIQVFNEDYSYHATIGTGVQGNGNDQFRNPYNVAVASDSKVYVPDAFNHRIQVFNADYSYLTTIGTGAVGSGNDQLSAPIDLTIDANGKIYITDFGNHRVQVFELSTDYQAEITPAAEGEVSVDIAAGAFSDEADNASTEAVTFSIYYDTAVPSVEISSTESGFTDQSPFAVSIVFSEEMTGFEAGDISVTNGNAGNLQSSDNITFTADITPAGDGEVIVEVGAGVATDLGGRDNTAAEAFSVTYDATPPTASITTEEPDPSDVSPFSITISPSEAITGLTSDDLQVTNGSVTSFTPPQYVYRQTIGAGIEGSSNDAFNNPWGISIASDGKIYVADRNNHRIQIFDANGDYLATMGTPGSAGSGDNQFNYPGGVTPASDGNIYVADYQINHRVQVFDADRNYLATMGTTGTFGSGNNQFNRPYDVAVADDGKIYVVDESNHRIQVFDADRNYLATMGTSGTFGTGDNQFSSPREITIASDGKIYVVDEGNHRIQVFDADRNYLATLGTTGTFGSSNDEFYDPQDVAVAPDGKIYVVDSRNNRVQVFESLTGYQAEITPDAEGEVGIEIAAGAFSDGAGNASTEAATYSIYYDTAVPTVEITSTESGFTDQSPFAVSIVFSEEMTGFEAGDISVTNGNAGNLQSSDNITFTADITPAGDGEVIVEVGAGVATDLGGRDNTAAEAFSVTYDATPPTASITTEEPDPTDVSPFSITISPSEAITGLTSDDLQVSNGSVTSFIPVYVYEHTIGTGIKGSSNDAFNGPYDLSVAPDGNVYVADQTNHRIQVFDAYGNYLTTMGTGTRGSGNDSFNNPISVSVASDGKIYVADFNNHRIQVFDAERTYLATMGIPATSGSGNDKFNGPSSVSVAPDGKIYVADYNNHRIQVFSAERNYEATIGGTRGSSNNELSFPIGVSVASDGKIYVADRFNHRIQVFDADRNYLATMGTSGISGSGNDAFNKPAGVTVAPDGKIYVSDRDNQRIQIFDANRNYLATIGTGTQGSGKEELNNPTGVSISPDGIIYVADFNNHRIQVFEPLTDYQAEITPAAEGEVSLEIAAGTFSDLSGKDNVEAATFSIHYDSTAPTVSISSAEGELTNQSPFLATFTFSEEVQGFTAEDISVTNGSAAKLQSSDNITYTAEITPAGEGEVSLAVAAELAADLAGNLSEASNSLGIAYDGTAPTVSITADEEGQTEQKSFEVTFTFSEAVSGFSAEDVSLENATLSALSSSDDKSYTATLTAVSGGAVSVSVAEGKATDAAGNGNVAMASALSIVFDQQPEISSDPQLEVTQISQISPEGSVLVTVSAMDVTEGTTFQDWTIVSMTDEEGNAVSGLSIDPATGEISVSQSSGLGNESRDFVLTLTVSDGTKVSKPAQVTISYRPVNQAPSFVKGEDLSLLPGAADYRYAGWASQVSAGPAHEAGQQLSFVVSNDQPDFFTSQPAIDASGELSFSLADNVSGRVTVTVQLKDDGGTANDGVDTSEPVTFTINVDKIVQTITFAPLQDVKVGQDPILLEASGGDSDEPITFSISTEPAQGVARLEGNQLIIEDVGEVTVTATQSGNDTYQDAEPVVRRFSITTNALFLPSAFTPNGDGSNDRFILRGGGGVASVEFTIYDRSRNVVFRSTDWEEITGQGWDGNYQGKKQPLGIYIWTLQGSYLNDQPLEVAGKNSGIIRLIR